MAPVATPSDFSEMITRVQVLAGKNAVLLPVGTVTAVFPLEFTVACTCNCRPVFVPGLM